MVDYDPSLARMLVTLMNSQEQEWGRISRILHDEVGQIMSAVGLQLDVLRMDMEHQVPEITARTAEIQQLLERAITLVRDLSYELNPAVVEKAGFQFAMMDRLIGRHRQKYPGSLRLMVDLGERLPPEVANAFYKIANQAVANAVQHGKCSQIEVLVKTSHKGIVMEVQDKGIGFPIDQVRHRVPGLGLLLMEFHASQAKLQLTITSTPGEGTIVRAVFPSSQGQRECKSAIAKA
jgi:signal transduction histidine kinase